MASLVFDYGTKHIGVAIAEPRASVSRGLLTVSSRKQTPNWSVIEGLVREWQPESFVVGLPLNMDGTRSDMCESVETFGRALGQRFEKEVVYVDERLSTFEARAQARESGVDRNLDEHADAARLIAETWIASNPDLTQRSGEGST